MNMGIKNQNVEIKRITDGEDHCFFGYYDIPAWNGDGTRHLCHKVKFFERFPEKEDAAEIGMIDMRDFTYKPLTSTTAWNFQQGAMLQWNPAHPSDEIIFNRRDGEEYRGVIRNVNSGEERILERPVANVDSKGRYALSINFDRVYDFRPGYGYTGVKDKWYDIECPEDDGIYLVDLETGKSTLTVSYREIWERFCPGREERKIVVNHITFNTEGDRFVYLARYFPEKDQGWVTAVITANTDGSGQYLLRDYAYASHYHWRDREHLLIYASGPENDQLYLLKDRTNKIDILDREYFLKDGHCSYSPDRRHLLYDSYPDEKGYRNLYLYDIRNRKGMLLGSFFSDERAYGDIRCDLHPRWNPSGDAITFDSTHEGHRHIYYADVSEYIK